jgi:hypothetical protein
MTIITKGMGIIMKKGGGDLLKKSKKFPGSKSDEQLQKKVDTRIRRGKRVRGIKGQIGGDDIDVHARIGRTQRYRNIAAQTFKAARNPEKYKSKVMESGKGSSSGTMPSNIDRKKASRRRKLRTKGSPFKIGTFNKKEIPQKYRKDIK